MCLTDTNGKPWAHSDTIKEGDKVRADGGFPCITKGAVLTVKRDPAHGKGLPSLYIDCRGEDHGEPQRHFLAGQAGGSGALIGLYLH